MTNTKQSKGVELKQPLNWNELNEVKGKRYELLAEKKYQIETEMYNIYRGANESKSSEDVIKFLKERYLELTSISKSDRDRESATLIFNRMDKLELIRLSGRHTITRLNKKIDELTAMLENRDSTIRNKDDIISLLKQQVKLLEDKIVSFESYTD